MYVLSYTDVLFYVYIFYKQKVEGFSNIYLLSWLRAFAFLVKNIVSRIAQTSPGSNCLLG